jgi:hypothetical protein
VIASTRDLILSSVSATSASAVSSIEIVPAFSLADERISLIPSSPSTASSTRRQIPVSTSSGVAPG